MHAVEVDEPCPHRQVPAQTSFAAKAAGDSSTSTTNLNVIARTSVKRYSNSDKPISEIAEELGVTTVMEGSVRYAGDRVRVVRNVRDWLPYVGGK